jgi:hypothetical protein
MVVVAATVPAEEADNGRCGQRCAVYSILVQLSFLTITATATEGQGDSAAAVISSADPFS